jgi:Double-GTPase 2
LTTDSPDVDPATSADGAGIDDVLAEGATAASDGADGHSRALALDDREANVLAARRRPTVLVLAGRVESGKTSIYAAIYERLGRGPFAGRLFAGSQTIAGFEARCHYWRTASGLDVPRMEHTSASALPWLHLRLRDVELELPAHDLLFGDFDGETFDRLLTNQVQPSELPFLRRADHVGVVIDGAHLADPAEREAEVTSIKYLIDALLKDGGVASPSALSIIVTKLDVLDAIENSGDRTGVTTALDSLTKFVAERTGIDVPVLHLAARSESDKFPIGHGLEALLELLTLRPTLKATVPPDPTPVDPLYDFVA